MVMRILGPWDLSVNERGHHFEGAILSIGATRASRERRGEGVENVRHLHAEVGVWVGLLQGISSVHIVRR